MIRSNFNKNIVPKYNLISYFSPVLLAWAILHKSLFIVVVLASSASRLASFAYLFTSFTLQILLPELPLLCFKGVHSPQHLFNPGGYGPFLFSEVPVGLG